MGLDIGGDLKMPWSDIDRIEEELGLVPHLEEKKRKRRLFFF
ncbi:MAG: hypothetical protein QXF61_11860 [Nitrososphaeria archaeon]